MMRFNEFVEKVEQHINLYLLENKSNASIRITECRKINECYIGLNVLDKNECISPTINLSLLYEDYKKDNDRDLSWYLSKIVNIISSSDGSTDFDISIFDNYETVKELLFIRVSSYYDNKDLLKDVPHKIIEDLVITCHISVNLNINELGNILVNNDIMKQYNVDFETLYNDALANSYKIKPLRIGSIMDMIMCNRLSDDIGTVLTNTDDDEISLFVLTNAETVNGASAIFYPDIMEEISDAFNSSFYIIPSSIHEVIIFSESAALEPNAVITIIKNVNKSCVDKCDKLTDSLYFYDMNKKMFTIVP